VRVGPKAEQGTVPKQRGSNDGSLGGQAPTHRRAGGSGEHASASPEHALLSLLQLACGSYEAAQDVLKRSLAGARMAALPRSASEIVAFVRQHVLRVLSEDIGPRLAAALGEDLVAALDEQLPAAERITIPPASVARSVHAQGKGSRRASASAPLVVALVDADRVGRTSLARALVRERWNVTLVESEADVADAGPLDVALVDGGHPSVQTLLESLARAYPGLAVVVRSKVGKTRAHARPAGLAGVVNSGGEKTRTRARPAGLDAFERVEVAAPEASPEDLVKAIRRATGS
jgi:hypothetical protein